MASTDSGTAFDYCPRTRQLVCCLNLQAFGASPSNQHAGAGWLHAGFGVLSMVEEGGPYMCAPAHVHSLAEAAMALHAPEIVGPTMNSKSSHAPHLPGLHAQQHGVPGRPWPSTPRPPGPCTCVYTTSPAMPQNWLRSACVPSSTCAQTGNLAAKQFSWLLLKDETSKKMDLCIHKLGFKAAYTTKRKPTRQHPPDRPPG